MLVHAKLAPLLSPTSFALCRQNIENKRTFELTEEELNVLRVEVDKYETGDDLKRYVMQRINLLKEMRCYRGLRHAAVRALV